MDDHANELILDTKITNEHKQVQDKLPYHYKPYFVTPLSIILNDTSTARNNWYTLIKTAIETTCTDNYTIFSSSKTLRTWVGIQSTP